MFRDTLSGNRFTSVLSPNESVRSATITPMTVWPFANPYLDKGTSTDQGRELKVSHFHIAECPILGEPFVEAFGFNHVP